MLIFYFIVVFLVNKFIKNDIIAWELPESDLWPY